MRKIVFSILVSGFIVTIFGCAAVQTEKAKSKEELMSAAGFVMVPADTPEEMQNLQSLTPLTMEYDVKDNKPLYWYADPDGCKCVYTGDQAAYDRYQRLRVEQNIANEEEDAAIANETAADNMWGWLGGPWGW